MLDLLAHAAEGAEHAAPGAFGIEALGPGFFVASAMLVVIAIMLWKGVPALIAGMLDQKIAGIRQQLDQAKALRAEAESDIAALRAGAERQAEEIVAKAKADATARIERHKSLAKDKIAAAERNAVEEVRAKVATAAAAASRDLIAQKHGEAEDRQLADRIIAEL